MPKFTYIGQSNRRSRSGAQPCYASETVHVTALKFVVVDVSNASREREFSVGDRLTSLKK